METAATFIPRSFKTLLNLILSQFSSVLYVPPETPTPNVDMPPDIPTTQRSWDIADIEGAEDEFTTLWSPVYALVVFVVVVLLEDPL
jgi:hypothetical protein